jgi:hypothetical protein
MKQDSRPKNSSVKESWLKTIPKPGKIKIIQKNQEEKYKDSREEKLDRPKTIFQNWKKL